MEKKEFLEKLVSLDERRCANDISFAVGRWGVAWVFDILIEIFQDTANALDPSSCCHLINAKMRITLLKGMRAFFEDSEIEPSEPTKLA